jgi:hypothetical protein
MKNLILAIFLVFCSTVNAQEIKILSAKEYFVNNSKDFILFCELTNHTKDTIILPLPIEAIGDDKINSLNYFYKIKTNPHNAFIIEEAPPPMVTQSAKLTTANVVTCKPYSTVKFNFDTKGLTQNGIYFENKIKIKQLVLTYKPFDLTNKDKQENLSIELMKTIFYKKAIKSKSFRLKNLATQKLSNLEP